MFKNYLRNAFRYFYKHPLATGINLFGLGVGVAVCFFALLYVRFELSYDDYHENADQIYRLVTNVQTATGLSLESTSPPMGPAIQDNFPEVTASVRLCLDYLIVQNEERDYFREEDVAYADSSLFSFFSFPLVQGNPTTALEKPLSVVLSETAARNYFGTTDCLGKTLLLDESPAQVTGVMEDMPQNTHFRVDMLVSMSTLLKAWNPGMGRVWKRFTFYTYLMLPSSPEITSLESKLTDFVRQHIEPDDAEYRLLLEPLTSVYLHGDPRGSRYGSAVTGDIQNVYIFSLIAAFVLFIACFNFINLTTALSLQRAKEIGVRKALGATRKQLLFQFLLDAVLLSTMALAVALILGAILLPTFHALTGKVIVTSVMALSTEIGWLVAGTLLVGLFSGIYPAVYLSGFSSIHRIKENLASGTRGTLLRKSLIVAQFSISILLISATVVVYQQLDYMQNQELGFNKEHKLVVDFHFDGRVHEHQEAIKQQFGKLPGVQHLTFSSSVPGRANRKYLTTLENAHQSMQELLSDVYFVEDDFLEQYQIDLVAGRFFSQDITSDSTEAMLINEAAVRSLGYADPEEVIGKRFTQQGSQGYVVGVVKDFHYHSFREAVRPLTLRMTPGYNLYTFMTISISPSDIPNTISYLEKEWAARVPGKPFNYFFADEAYQAQYVAEERFGRLFTCLALLAILISCLGLLGLAAFSTKLRVREIGIRKVLGASVGSILHLLSQEYIRLILLALLIAVPVTNYFITEWLQGFAYRLETRWWWFVIPGLTVLLIALLTVSGQTIRAARKNPVDSLRYE
ncbi:MAG: FtsX-like permease family protein [Cyclobacteriaceae bacterium]